MTEIAAQEKLPIPLYHGTSSLFLGSIIRAGLGGANPIADWNVLEFAHLIYLLVEKHASALQDFILKAQSFKFMMEQKSAAMNFQHEETYLSPSLSTAVRYAADNRYGSELLTKTLDFLAELIRLKVDGVADKLYQAYPHIFEKLDIYPAPLLIQVENIDSAALASEGGGDAEHALEFVHETVRSSPEMCDVLLQQTNFRLRRPVSVTELKIWFIDVVRWVPYGRPEFSLYPLSTHDATPSRAGQAIQKSA